MRQAHFAHPIIFDRACRKGMTMKRLIKQLLVNTPVGRWALLPYRASYVARATLPGMGDTLRWLFRSRECTNFTYDLSERNKTYLAAFVSEITGIKASVAAGYIAELEADTDLRAHIQEKIRNSSSRQAADMDVRYCRRFGWYALVRAMKPSVVIETGLDKGLGAVVLCSALLKNQAEGFPGCYYGTDINPKAGYLLSGPYATVGKILYGDSIESLRRLDVSIDLFINDSDHSSDYEAQEYQTIADSLSERAIVIGDNAHVTDELFRFSEKTGRQFLYWQENPIHHWYPGGGIGVAFANRHRVLESTLTPSVPPGNVLIG